MANNNTQDLTRVITGKVRFSYCHLITPRAQKPGDEPKYGVTLLIPKTDAVTLQKIQAAMLAAIQNGVATCWNGAKPAMPALPLHDGDGLKQSGEKFGDECKGHWVMTCSSKTKPEILDRNLQAIISPNEIYSGMYGRVAIRFFPYHNSGKKGVGCGLNNLQKLDDGEPLGGRTCAMDDFSSVDLPPQYPIPGTYPAPQPQYNPPVPQYAPQPQYNPPVPQYAPQPQYNPPVPQYAPQHITQIDPITGLPIVPKLEF